MIIIVYSIGKKNKDFWKIRLRSVTYSFLKVMQWVQRFSNIWMSFLVQRFVKSVSLKTLCSFRSELSIWSKNSFLQTDNRCWVLNLRVVGMSMLDSREFASCNVNVFVPLCNTFCKRAQQSFWKKLSCVWRIHCLSISLVCQLLLATLLFCNRQEFFRIFFLLCLSRVYCFQHYWCLRVTSKPVRNRLLCSIVKAILLPSFLKIKMATSSLNLLQHENKFCELLTDVSLGKSFNPSIGNRSIVLMKVILSIAK